MNSLGLGIEGFNSYRPDIDFIGAYRDTVNDSARLSSWMDEWVFHGESHQEYLKKLGKDRLQALTAGIGENEGQQNLAELLNTVSFSPEYSGNELTIVAAARKNRGDRPL